MERNCKRRSSSSYSKASDQTSKKPRKDTILKKIKH